MKENQKGQVFWDIWSWNTTCLLLDRVGNVLCSKSHICWFKPSLVPSTKTTLRLALGLTLLVEDRQPKGNKISRVGYGLAEGCCTKVVLAIASSLLKAFLLWSTATVFCKSQCKSEFLSFPNDFSMPPAPFLAFVPQYSHQPFIFCICHCLGCFLSPMNVCPRAEIAD